MLPTLALLLLSGTSAASAEDPARLVRADPRAAGLDATSLLGGVLDVVHVDPRTGAVELIAHDEDLARLRRTGVPFEVLEEDLVAFYAARLARAAVHEPRAAPRLGAWLSPPFGQGSLGGYYTLAEIGSVLDQIAAAFPALVTPRASIGTSIEGRELWMVKLSDQPGVDEDEPEVRFDALHHAREPQSMQVLLWTLLSLVEGYGTDPLATWIVDHREIWFLPCVNPDGYAYNQAIAPGGGGLWRKNRRSNGGGSFGVDLNRNYPFQWGFDDVGSSPVPDSETYRGPSPASEPEVAAMVAFLASRGFATSISCHTYSNLWLAPWGHTTTPPAQAAQLDEVGALATEVNGYPFGPASTVLYLANGATLDHDLGVHGTFAWSPEIGGPGDGFWPAPERIEPLAEENRLALWRTALAAGAFVHAESIAVSEAGDGDGHFEPGESIEVRVHARNSGRETTTGAVTLALASSSPWATVLAGAHDLGPLASFSGADNDATPLVLALSPAAPPGAKVDLELTLAWDGYAEVEPLLVPLGEPRPFLADDLEVELGWLAGVPGDTATTGLWAYGDPVGTTSGGLPSNPEDDATPGPGVRCYATGNGSTSAGGDDVDDGWTTLITPAMDLSSVSEALVSYERWFVDYTTADDALEVSVSNDDGATWTPVESFTAPTGVWSRTSFLLGEHVPPSNEVRLRFVASDDPNNSLVEAGVDELEVEVYETGPRFHVYGRPAVGAPLAFHLSGPDGSSFAVYWSTGPANLQVPFLAGTVLIDPGAAQLFLSGAIIAGGLARAVVPSPNDPGLVGLTFWFQGIVLAGGMPQLTNRDEVTFE